MAALQDSLVVRFSNASGKGAFEEAGKGLFAVV